MLWVGVIFLRGYNNQPGGDLRWFLVSAASTKRNGWLDVVRGLAIVAVIMVHTGHSTKSILGASGIHLSDNILAFTDLGKAGVELFFLLADGCWPQSMAMYLSHWVALIGCVASGALFRFGCCFWV